MQKLCLTPAGALSVNTKTPGPRGKERLLESQTVWQIPGCVNMDRSPYPSISSVNVNHKWYPPIWLMVRITGDHLHKPLRTATGP
jgi:hypothetical protein